MAGKIDKQFKNGLVKATVWKNKSGAGDEFKTVSVNKSYQKDGEWKNSNSFGADDLDKAIDVLTQAQNYLNGNDGDETVY